MNKEILTTLLKRIAISVLLLILLISFLFILLRISPGDPTLKFISPELNPKLAEKVRESFNLNSSILEQYKTFLFNLIKGDFGISYTYRIPVVDVIKEYLPFTIIFSLLSFMLQIGFGFLLALAAVKKINGKIDNTISKLSLIVYALPSFVIGVALIYLFSETFKIFPSSGLTSYDFDSYSFPLKFFDYLEHLILPLTTLSAGGVVVYYKYIRDNMEEIYNKPFILYMRSNGMNENEITRKHVIPNAVSPLISVAGVELGILFGGALITEVIFSLPGMGRLTINAIFARDYPLIMGCTAAAGFLIILSNFFADLFKAKMDKRLIKGI